MPDRVRITLLCEDRNQEIFFRRVCHHLDQRPRVRVAPSGTGSAEQWVRENFAKELIALRSYGRERVGLIVVIDGDLEGVAGRKRKLNEAAQKAGVSKRADNERVAICVPTRNIETWIMSLCRGVKVTETDDYSKSIERDEIKKAADLCKSKADDCNLLSCGDARREIARLDTQKT